MKPSERIKQIMIHLALENGGDPLDYKIGAIWDYLDEEYDKNLSELTDGK